MALQFLKKLLLQCSLAWAMDVSEFYPRDTDAD